MLVSIFCQVRYSEIEATIIRHTNFSNCLTAVSLENYYYNYYTQCFYTVDWTSETASSMQN